MLARFRSILASPMAYKLWCKLVGEPAWAKVLVNEYIQPMPGARILEIGCGPGTIVGYLPPSDYLGFDLIPSTSRWQENVSRMRSSFANVSVSSPWQNTTALIWCLRWALFITWKTVKLCSCFRLPTTR